MHVKGAPRDPIVPITGKVAYLFLEKPSRTERLNKNRNPWDLKNPGIQEILSKDYKLRLMKG